MTDILATYLIHSTVILGAAWLLVRLPGLRRAETRALVLKSALLASVVMPLVPGLSETIRLRPDPFTQISVQQEVAALGQDFQAAPAPSPSPAGAPLTSEMVAAPVAGQSAPGRSVHWSLVAQAVAAAFAVAAIVRMSIAALQLRRVILSSTAPSDERLLELMDRAVAGAGVRHPRWLQAVHTASPVAVGWGTVILPEGLLDRLGRVRTQAVLIHELTHLRRRDPVWNVALSFLAHALAFQPLNLLLLRGWRAAAEEVCDAIAAEAVDDPRAMASSLVALARGRHTSGASVVAAAGAGTGTKQLASRVQALLARRPTRMVRWHGVLSLLLLIGVGLVVPPIGLAQEQDLPPDGPRPLVVLDPGHGGEDVGVHSEHGAEKDLVLAVALSVRDRLVAEGIDVAMTRSADSGPTLVERAKAATGAAAFVSLHTSAYTDPTIAGVRTYIATTLTGVAWGRELSILADSQRLAEELQRHVVAATRARDGGVTRRNYAVLDAVHVPAALIEIGHQTNPEEDARIWTEAYQESVSEAIATAIAAFVMASRSEPGPAQQADAARPERGSSWLWMTVIGGISFDPALREVQALTPGGSAIFEERIEDRMVRLEVSETDAGLVQDYSVDGRLVDEIGEAQRWLSDFLSQAFGLYASPDGFERLALRTSFGGGVNTSDQTTFSLLHVPSRSWNLGNNVVRLVYDVGIDHPRIPIRDARLPELSAETAGRARVMAFHAVAHGLVNANQLPSILEHVADRD